MYSQIENLMLVADSGIRALNCIRSVHVFSDLGIVNPRYIPAGLIARYVLSVGSDTESAIDSLNTQDVNMVAIERLEVENFRLVIPKAIGLVLGNRSGPLRPATVSEVYRFVEFLYPLGNGTRKDDSRIACEYVVGQILKGIDPEMSRSFIACLLAIFGCVHLGSAESLSEISSLVEPDFCQKFVIQNVHHILSGESIQDRFVMIGKLYCEFASRQLVEGLNEEDIPIVSGKRRRQSRGNRKVKRQRRAVEVSCDDEYASGESSDDDSFETCLEDN